MLTLEDEVFQNLITVGGEGFALFPCLLKEICAIQFGTNAQNRIFGQTWKYP